MKRMALALIALVLLVSVLAGSSFQSAKAGYFPYVIHGDEQFPHGFQKVYTWPDPYEYGACKPLMGTGAASYHGCWKAYFDDGEYLYRPMLDSMLPRPMHPGCASGDVFFEGYISGNYMNRSEYQDWDITIGFADPWNNWSVCYVPYESTTGTREFYCEIPDSQNRPWATFGIGAISRGSVQSVPVTKAGITIWCTDEQF